MTRKHDQFIADEATRSRIDESAAKATRIAGLKSEIKAYDLRMDNDAAIIAKLPKTADGVPVVPGMRVYGAFRDGVMGGTYLGNAPGVGRMIFQPDKFNIDDPHLINIDLDSPVFFAASRSVYSTHAAALAAKGGK